MQWKRNSAKLAFDKGDTLQDMFLSLNIKGRAKTEQKVHILALYTFFNSPSMTSEVIQKSCPFINRDC